MSLQQIEFEAQHNVESCSEGGRSASSCRVSGSVSLWYEDVFLLLCSSQLVLPCFPAHFLLSSRMHFFLSSPQLFSRKRTCKNRLSFSLERLASVSQNQLNISVKISLQLSFVWDVFCHIWEIYWPCVDSLYWLCPEKLQLQNNKSDLFDYFKSKGKDELKGPFVTP